MIGERNFLADGETGESGLETALKWIAGLVIGEPNYVELQRPVSGMSGDDGRILVVDASHKAVMVFDMTGRKLLKWEQAAAGQAFVSPIAVTGDGAGGYLVTDAELGEVFRLDSQGEPAGRFGKGILSRPTGIAQHESGRLVYVADTAAHDIKVFDASGQLIEIIGAQGKGSGTFNTPTLLSVDGDQLYVADTLNFRVQVLDTAGDNRLSFGDVGLFVGNMTRPKGVAVGRDGRIYVVESYFDHLLVYDKAGQLLLGIGGTGQEIGQFYLPSGVWTDDQGRIFVADMFNGRVVVLKELSGA